MCVCVCVGGCMCVGVVGGEGLYMPCISNETDLTTVSVTHCNCWCFLEVVKHWVDC